MRSISSRAERAHGHALMSSFHDSAASQSRFGSNGTASIRTGSDSDPGGKGGLGLLQPGSSAVGRAEGVRASRCVPAGEQLHYEAQIGGQTGGLTLSRKA